MTAPLPILRPPPREMAADGGVFFPGPAPRVLWEVPEEWLFPAMPALREALPPAAEMALPPPARPAAIRVGEDRRLPPDGFTLRIAPDGAVLRAGSRAGLFYGASALAGLLRAAAAGDGAVPACRVSDAPDFARRGVLLDVSRGKVPTMPALFRLADLLSSLRYNELQLYFEHPFAYPGHAEVWLNASPLTACEIRALDAYCQSRCIELVPNQNSFGHLERWLGHPRYAPLAELPRGGAPLPWGGTRPYPSALTPEGDASVAFLGGLYAGLLPNFTSKTLNVGFDEVFDLRGGGKSAGRIRREGEAGVFLDFLRRVRDEARRRGADELLFWADMILRGPAVPEGVPPGCRALVWGYEAGHPFEEQCARLEGAGIPFSVCPGTSSWRSLAGRTDNMTANIRAAAAAGRRHGARGLLLCDWGDAGHWQPLAASLPAFVEGARRAWRAEPEPGRDLARDAEASGAVAPGHARPLMDLGNLHLRCGATRENASELFQLLSRPMGEPVDAGVTPGRLRDVLRRLDAVLEGLPAPPPSCGDEFRAQHDETLLAGRMIRAACLRGILRLGAMPGGGRRLKEEMQALRKCFAEVWLLRNRPGGLAESLGLLPE